MCGRYSLCAGFDRLQLRLQGPLRAAWRHRRCLIPADAFWEQGQWLRRRDGDLFWLAGLWERWIGPDGSELDSCCVLTTAPNGLRALEPLLLPWDGGDWQADGAAMALDQPQLELDL
jgi:hypothetical protein